MSTTLIIVLSSIFVGYVCPALSMLLYICKAFSEKGIYYDPDSNNNSIGFSMLMILCPIVNWSSVILWLNQYPIEK